MGSALLNKKARLELLLRTMRSVLHCPITMKTRMGWNDTQLIARELIPFIANSGVSALTVRTSTNPLRDVVCCCCYSLCPHLLCCKSIVTWANT
jgi:tRNA-dihydrouridine synthase